MSRINDKTIRPLPLPGEKRGREPAREREVPLPPGARLVSTQLSPLQRENNQRLIALYHSLKEKKASPSEAQDFEARLKGWKKRPADKKRRGGQQNEEDDREDEQEQ